MIPSRLPRAAEEMAGAQQEAGGRDPEVPRVRGRRPARHLPAGERRYWPMRVRACISRRFILCWATIGSALCAALVFPHCTFGRRVRPFRIRFALRGGVGNPITDHLVLRFSWTSDFMIKGWVLNNPTMRFFERSRRDIVRVGKGKRSIPRRILGAHRV